MFRAATMANFRALGCAAGRLAVTGRVEFKEAIGGARAGGGDEGGGAGGKRNDPGIHDMRRLPISAAHAGRPST